MSHNPQNPNPLTLEITAFIIDRQARRLSPRTIQFYQNELDWFAAFLLTLSVPSVPAITPEHIRLYLIHLSHTRNPGGLHAAFRAIKAFLNWFAVELDDPAYKNPIRKIQPPRISHEPLPGISLGNFNRLLSSCDRSPLGQRDRALLLALLDTGLRRDELLQLDLSDLDLRTGAVNVRHGKGDKPRTVYLGARARREIIRCLRHRQPLQPGSPLWVTQSGARLTASGLRQVLRRRAAQVDLPEPGCHDFRRLFAIQSLRNGIDLVTLMHLMGHTSTAVLQRYLKLIDSDLQLAHARSSPVDNLK